MSRGGARGYARPPLPIEVAHKTADQSNSTLVKADVTDLSFSVAAGGIYVFEFNTYGHAAATTTGIVLAVNGPASPTFVRYVELHAVSGSGILAGGATAFDTEFVNNNASASATNPFPSFVYGYLVNGVNAGTLALRFRSEVDTSAVTIQRGSWGRLTRVG